MTDRPPARPSLWWPSSLIATFFGTGLAPVAPGTAGSLAAALLIFALQTAMPVGLVLILASAPFASALGSILPPALLLALTYPLGLWASRRYMAASGEHDPGAIVIDEVAGIFATWLSAALCFPILAATVFALIGRFDASIPPPARLTPTPHLALSPLEFSLAAFLLFRLFDILKPGPIRQVDRQVDGAAGVMLDDLVAGLAAGACLALLSVFAMLAVFLP